MNKRNSGEKTGTRTQYIEKRETRKKEKLRIGEGISGARN
jgi:hypothetical protein